MENKFLYKSNGNYFGFIQNDSIFDRDGVCLGWLEGTFVWDTSGRFRGTLIKISGQTNFYYVWSNKFAISPLPKSSRQTGNLSTVPAQPAAIAPINLPVGWVDAF